MDYIILRFSRSLTRASVFLAASTPGSKGRWGSVSWAEKHSAVTRDRKALGTYRLLVSGALDLDSDMVLQLQMVHAYHDTGHA